MLIPSVLVTFPFQIDQYVYQRSRYLFDLLAETHDVFVNGIVDDLLEQDVGAIIVVRSITNTPNVHACTKSNVLQRRQRFYLTLVVIVFGITSHMIISLIVLGFPKVWPSQFTAVP